MFVGHSLGPWVQTLFTVAHPDAVVGMVMVDPRGLDVTEAWLAALPPPMSSESEALTAMRDFATSFSDPSANPERVAIPASGGQVRTALATTVPPFGDLPLIDLQAGLTPDGWSDLPEPVRAAWDAAWFDGQSAFASASTVGRVDVLPESGHNVQDYAPSAVIDSILEVLDRR